MGGKRSGDRMPGFFPALGGERDLRDENRQWEEEQMLTSCTYLGGHRAQGRSERCWALLCPQGRPAAVAGGPQLPVGQRGAGGDPGVQGPLSPSPRSCRKPRHLGLPGQGRPHSHSLPHCWMMQPRPSGTWGGEGLPTMSLQPLLTPSLFNPFHSRPHPVSPTPFTS